MLYQHFVFILQWFRKSPVFGSLRLMIVWLRVNAKIQVSERIFPFKNKTKELYFFQCAFAKKYFIKWQTFRDQSAPCVQFDLHLSCPQRKSDLNSCCQQKKTFKFVFERVYTIGITSIFLFYHDVFEDVFLGQPPVAI